MLGDIVSADLARRRLARLSTDGDNFYLLALDHAITHGTYAGGLNIPRCLDLAQRAGITGVVLNPGNMASVPVRTNYGTILQTYASDRPRASSTKLPMLSPSDALHLYDPDALAIELDLSHPRANDALQQACHTLTRAKILSQPTLVMLGLRADLSPVEAFENGIAAATAIGGDLIKVGLPRRYFDMDRHHHRRLESALATAAPVVLAGGAELGDLETSAELAAKLGFVGFCVGRGIFQSNHPESAVNLLQGYFEQ